MATKKLPPIKPRSRASKHARIRNLKCYPEMYNRILEGWPLVDVAKFIQDIKKESTDISHSSLVIALQEFRSDLPPAELAKRRLPRVIAAAEEKLEEGLDELKEMQRLYQLQMQRVEMDFSHEKKINKTLPSMGQEVRIAKEVLSAYADLKMSLGLSKRHLGKMEVDARVLTDVALRFEKAGPTVQQVMGNPQSRQKILGLVEKLLTKSTAKVIGDPETISEPDAIEAHGETVEEESAVRHLEDPEEDLFPEYGNDAPSEEEPSLSLAGLEALERLRGRSNP